MCRPLLLLAILLGLTSGAEEKPPVGEPNAPVAPTGKVPVGEPIAPIAPKTNVDKLLSGRLSFSLLWGAAFTTATGPTGGPPIYLGATVSYWVVNRFVLDLHGSHSFNALRTNVMLGPRVRSWTVPIAASIGFQVGVIHDQVQGARFGLSPIATLDMVIADHVLAQLDVCVDVPIPTRSVVGRVGLNLGWRF